MTCVAVFVSVALVLLTSWLHQTTANAAASVEAVRLAEEAELDLLLLARAADPLLARDLEASLRGGLEAWPRYTTEPQDAALVTNAEALLAQYVESRRDGSEVDRTVAHAALFGALEELVEHSPDARA